MNASPQQIFVYGAAAAREQLASFGFDVSPADIAPQQVAEALQARAAFRLIVGLTNPTMAQHANVLVPYANKCGVPVVVLGVDGIPPDINVEGTATRIDPPAKLNDLFAALGYASAGERGDVPLRVIPPPSKPAPTPDPMPLPATPAAHVEPMELPAAPAAPDTPAVPVVPQVAAPVVPAVPAIPATPVVPAAPAVPATPVVPQTAAPVAPAAPVVPTAPTVAPAPAPADLHRNLNPTVATSRSRRGAVADECIVMAWKGGVTKTTTSYALAQRAAEAGIERVCLIDGNRGQGGIRSMLRLDSDTTLPTVHHLAYSDTHPADVVCSPDMLNQARRAERGLAPVQFSVIFAPHIDEGNPRDTPARCYTRALEHARQYFDLVIVDTQTLDAESSDLFQDAFIPALRRDAWGIALTDPSRESVNNLPILLRRLADAGVHSARLLFAVTLWKGEFPADMAAGYTQSFANQAAFAGSAIDDPEFAEQLGQGVVDTDSPAVRPLLDNVLYTVTGLDQFRYHDDDAPPARGGRIRMPWQRKRGRK